jgi:hypothetical protein
MENIIPAVSSAVRGPAGIAHLPRLWLTCIAESAGVLAGGYASGEAFDRMLVEDLQLDAAMLAAHLKALPTYQATEAWVLANAAAANRSAIAQHNARVDADPTVLQTDLADWARLHAFLSERSAAPPSPMVPLVSMHTVGPRGIKHLPRMWAKALLHRAGALPDTWRSG